VNDLRPAVSSLAALREKKLDSLNQIEYCF
jgi:hypothetical protein